jgi:hypothetical protein
MAFLSPVRYLGVDDIVAELRRRGLSLWLYGVLLINEISGFSSGNCYPALPSLSRTRDLPLYELLLIHFLPTLALPCHTPLYNLLWYVNHLL